MKIRILLLSLLLSSVAVAQTAYKPYVDADALRPYGPVPTAAQLAWQRMEMNMFCHFGPNTFTDVEWGDGTEAESLFRPTDLQCSQWAQTARLAGFKGIIITAKHHDGFCLWPNPASRHTVRHSPWRKGRGDVLLDLSQACRAQGLKFGVYISPWDRNAPTYGTPAYNQTFVATLNSALSHYGPIFEQWFDGACGEGPNGKRQTYDWPLFNATVLQYQPQAVIFSNVGPGCRWVGNESGEAGRTCWSRINTEGCTPSSGTPSQALLNQGEPQGASWIPAETDVSIRPGWFFHAGEQPKTLQQLLSIYYTSVGRNSLLLLNVPPDRRGHIHETDSVRLMEFRAALDQIFADDLAQSAHIVASGHYMPADFRFAPHHLLDTSYHTYWAAPLDSTTATLTLSFSRPRTFNRLLLQEYIPLGQRVSAFHVEVMNDDGTWTTVASETTIGYKRILLIPTVTASVMRVTIDASYANPILNRLAVYYDTIFQ